MRLSAESCGWAGRRRLAVGARVGVPWLGLACGGCPYCRDGRENLCDRPAFTATAATAATRRTVAEAAFAVRLADDVDAAATAPLLCAGLIGWRR